MGEVLWVRRRREAEDWGRVRNETRNEVSKKLVLDFLKGFAELTGLPTTRLKRPGEARDLFRVDAHPVERGDVVDEDEGFCGSRGVVF